MADQEKDFLKKLRATFRVEAQEHLQDIVSNIVLLEQAGDTAKKEVVERLLRRLHTLKGAARAVNLADLETLCHSMESVFSSINSSGQSLRPAQFDLLHQAGSLAYELLQEPSGRIRNQARALISGLERLSVQASGVKSPEDTEPADAEPAFSVPDDIVADEPASMHPTETAQPDVIRVQSKSLDALRYQAEALLSVDLGLQHHINDLLALADDISEYHERTQILERSADPANRKRPARQEASSAPGRMRERRLEPRAGRQGAIDGQRSSELALRCRRLAETLGRTRRNFVVIRSKLMDTALETSLVPFSSTLDQLPGLVRNLARSRDKEAVLSIQGEGVRIDRRVLDIIREALIHLVTNAVDHGIESVETRLANGKQPAGTVRVTVSQCWGNQVSIVIADDGTGIDVSSVVESVIGSGARSAAQVDALNEQQKLQLILHTGVTTSEEVTQVSGRGVGLAIVAEKIASIGGELWIENTPGAGCSFQLMLPVRLATLRGLVLRIRGSQFVFPLSGLDSVRALKSGDIQTVEGRETLLLGARVIPALRLGRLLGLDRSLEHAAAEENIALIVRNGGSTFALLVDEILSEQEVLPKDLGKQLRRVRYITGATQLGDGSLVPILGLEDIAKYGLAASDRAEAATHGPAGALQLKRVLVAEDSITSRLLLKHILESAGYQVETAVDGLDALSKLRHEDFDALVSDIEMPQLDGLALTERIRTNQKTSDMPVILVTSLHSAAEKERGLRAGADAYIVKGSFDQDNLLATIRRLV